MKSNLFKIYLISNILLLVLPLSIGTVTYFEAVRLLTESSTEIARTLVGNFRTIFDTRFDEIKRLSDQIIMNSKVRKYLFLREPRRNTTIYLSSEILEDFNRFRSLNSFISEFYVYFRTNQTVLTDSSKYDLSLFSGITESKNLERLIAESGADFTLGNFNWLRLPSGSLILVRSFSPDSVGKPEAYIFVVPDLDQIRALLGSAVPRGFSWINDSIGRILIASDPTLEGRSVSELNIYDRTYVSFGESSQHFDWTIQIHIPRPALMARVSYILIVAAAVTIAALIPGLILAYILARRRYEPIRSVTDLLSKAKASLRRDGEEDELMFIRRSLENTIAEDKELRQRLEDQKQVIRTSLLLRLLRSSPVGVPEIESRLRGLSIDLSNGCVIVVVFQIGFNNLPTVTTGTNSTSALQFGLLRMMEEASGAPGKGFAVEIDWDRYVLLFRSESGETASAQAGFVSLAIIRKVEELWAIPALAGVGIPAPSPTAVSLSFRTALETVEYGLFQGITGVLDHRELRDAGKNFSYPLSTERLLVNSVLSGDWKTAQNIITGIFEENFEHRKLEPRIQRMLAFDLLATALKTLQTIRIDSNSVFGERDPLDRLMGSATVTEIREEVLNSYRSLCEFIELNRRNRSDGLKAQILESLEKIYTNPIFSQSLLAEQLGITPSYLSTFFKEHVGENMVDFVNRKRVRLAKSLLQEKPDRPLVEIAAEVGCLGDKALIRLFNKYEGITPGRYRDSAGSEEARRDDIIP